MSYKSERMISDLGCYFSVFRDQTLMLYTYQNRYRCTGTQVIINAAILQESSDTLVFYLNLSTLPGFCSDFL